MSVCDDCHRTTSGLCWRHAAVGSLAWHAVGYLVWHENGLRTDVRVTLVVREAPALENGQEGD